MPEPEVAASATNPDSTAAAEPVAEATSLLGAAPVEGAASPEAQTDNKDAKAEPAGVPEKYELKLPEGVAPDETAMAEFETLAREAKLDNATAQKIIDYKVKLDQAANEAHSKQVNDWAVAVKADKEIGGKEFEANIKAAQQAVARFGGPELTAALNNTGLGNHPELVRFCARIGKAMGEGSFTPAGSGATDNRSAAKILYPGMN